MLASRADRAGNEIVERNARPKRLALCILCSRCVSTREAVEDARESRVANLAANPRRDVVSESGIAAVGGLAEHQDAFTGRPVVGANPDVIHERNVALPNCLHSASRCQNQFRHTEACYRPRPPRRADFITEKLHDARLRDTEIPVKEMTTPPVGVVRQNAGSGRCCIQCTQAPPSGDGAYMCPPFSSQHQRLISVKSAVQNRFAMRRPAGTAGSLPPPTSKATAPAQRRPTLSAS